MIKTLYPTFQKWSEKGSVYLYSDPHFDDPDMEEFFNYASPDDQIANINKIVTRSDYLIILGDFGDPKYLPRIKTPHLIGVMGNHDQGTTKYAPYFEELYSGPVFISEKILLSHEPIEYPYAMNIHGHAHKPHNGVANWYSFNDPTHLNVAADVIGYTPVSLGKLIKDGLLSEVPSIHRETIDRAIQRKSGEK